MSQAVIESTDAAPAIDFDDPAALAAPYARTVAAEKCAVDTATGESCAWYHGGRLYARALGIGVDKSLREQAGFFTATLGALAADGARRVLVSGTADYAMPALVMASFRAGRSTLDLSVVDRCPTPLDLTRWYADRCAVPVHTEAVEFLDYAPSEPFDVVCADSFLAQFPEADRRALMGAWRGALRQGGHLVTTNRIRPAAAGETVRATSARVRDYRKAAREAASLYPGLFDIDTDEIVAMMGRYAARKRTYPVRSQDEIIDLFQAGGFRVDRLDVVGDEGGRNAGYARIVATRL